MSTKLTLTLDKDVIERAKSYARIKNRSLSDIVENYLKSLTSDRVEEPAVELSPRIKSLKGSFKLPPGFDYQEELEKALIEKHL